MTRLLKNSLVRFSLGLAAPVALLLLWSAQAEPEGARSLAFASLDAIAAALVHLAASGQLLRDALVSLSRAVTGLVFGGVLGMAVGIAMASSPLVDRLAGPLYHSIRQVPLLGWLPLIGLWLGNGDDARLLIVSLAAFYPTVLNTYEGFAHVEKRYLEVGRLYDFSPAQRFRHILWPAALPLVLTGIAQALAFAWIGTIGTEILLGSGSGLGVTMATAQAQQRVDIIIVAICASGLLGFFVNHVLVLLRRQILRWQGAHQ